MVLSSYSNNVWVGADVFNPEPVYEAKQAEADQLVNGGDDDLHHHHHQLDYYWDPFELLPNYAPFLDPYFHDRFNINNMGGGGALFPENNYTTPLLPFDPLFSQDEMNNNNNNNYIPLENLWCPKRQKLSEVLPYCSDYVAEHEGVLKHRHGNGKNKCVSVQSIAARERRRKITEKTQDLGKLVPGGNKMNTAEMLQAAFNYVKFLEAQLGILQFLDSSFPQENEKAACKENMQIVTNPKVQEKLYMEEKCMVPRDVVLWFTTLSKPPLSDQLTQLLAFPPNE